MIKKFYEVQCDMCGYVIVPRMSRRHLLAGRKRWKEMGVFYKHGKHYCNEHCYLRQVDVNDERRKQKYLARKTNKKMKYLDKKVKLVDDKYNNIDVDKYVRDLRGN